jgi:O-6-methylguanine DNA methyltransferase
LQDKIERGKAKMIGVYTQNIDGVWFGVALREKAIVSSCFSANQQATISSLLSRIPYNEPFQVFVEPSAFAQKSLTALKSIYDGKDADEDIALAMDGLPAYTQKVLAATLKIPVGYVTSYGAIAKAAGGGPRAVGNVMASNPFMPIVPCHRVVKSDFTLGGYGGGLKVKLELLGKEKRGYSSPKEVQVGGGQLEIFPVEYVLRKFPQCAWLRKS